MAKFYLKDYVKTNDVSGVVAVSWQIALDPTFILLVDETIENRTDIDVWSSPLKRIDSQGLYDDSTKLYVRVKIYTENNGELFESDWYPVELNDVDDRIVNLTDKYGNVISQIEYDNSPIGYKTIW